MSIHTGEKPYHCNQCQKSFAWAHILKQNLRTHSGEKPYYCNECKKYFTQNSNLKSHMRTHTGEKPYACISCSKLFGKASAPKQHELLHRYENPSPCNVAKGSLHIKKTVKLGKKSKPLLVPPSPLQLGNSLTDILHRTFAL